MTDIYLDCADPTQMREAVKNPLVKGVTSNPSLMRAAGVTDYEVFARKALEIVDGLPISFEVFSDDFQEMENQARRINSWGKNIYIKIPVTNTYGDSTEMVVRELLNDGIKCNVTAIFTEQQVTNLLKNVGNHDHLILSVFAGRMADCGIDPSEFIYEDGIPDFSDVRFLWASPREVFNIYQAEKNQWDIITVSPELLKKYELLKGKDLTEYSRETVQMFYNDAKKAGYKI